MADKKIIAVVRALYAFNGEEAGDLTFNEDEVIRVIKKDASGWWRGITDDGREGDFPYNYVEVINEADAPRVRTASVFVADGASKNLKDSVDTLKSVKVAPVRGKPAFTVTATYESSTLSDTKTMDDVRHLDDMLKFLYPNYDRPLPPLWADKIFENDFAANKKASIIESYLQKVLISDGVGTEQSEFALVFWLSRDNAFRTSPDTRQAIEKADLVASKADGQRHNVESIAKSIEIAAVNYNWEASDPVELALAAGTFVLVREQHTPNEGWWEGEDACGAKGIFPSNYVKLLPTEDVFKAVNGELRNRPLPQPEHFGAFNTPAQPSKEEVKAKASNRQPKTENNFKIASLDAFDEMLSDGFTMLNSNQELHTKSASAVVPKTGDQVTLSYVAYVWDCQKQRIIEFAASDLPDKNDHVGPLVFTVGRDETIKGLDRAVQNLEKGQKSRVVIRPELGYGEVGSPPSVPPNCHLVYDITLDNFSEGNLDNPVSPVLNSGYVMNRAKRPPINATYHDM